MFKQRYRLETLTIDYIWNIYNAQWCCNISCNIHLSLKLLSIIGETSITNMITLNLKKSGSIYIHNKIKQTNTEPWACYCMLRIGPVSSWNFPQAKRLRSKDFTWARQTSVMFITYTIWYLQYCNRPRCHIVRYMKYTLPWGWFDTAMSFSNQYLIIG